MAIIRKKEIHEMNEEKLRKQLGELRLELSKARSQIIVGGAAANPGRIKEQRRVIARILTELHKRKNKTKVVVKPMTSDIKNTSPEKVESVNDNGGV
jgi:large subunit ribosomal protein L29